MSPEPTQEVLSEAINEVETTDAPSNLSIESLALLITTERLDQLEKKTMEEFKELKERQDAVRALHKLLKEINANTNQKGELDASNKEELQKLLDEAKEKYGIEFKNKDGKYKFTKDDRDRLVENVKMSVDDLNVQNEMQLQTITRLTNERYESYQMARTILKPLHDDKVQKARAIAGR